MVKAKSLIDTIKEQEYILAKYKFVLEKFPDAKFHNGWIPDFSSKSVNLIYTGFDFEQGRRTLNVVPYYNLKYTYNGVDEVIKMHSLPRRSRLCRITWKKVDGKRVIAFSRLSFNLKNNNFKDDMLNDCRTQIMQFIQKNPNYHLDTKHLEPRLKKLLLFT